MLGNIAVIGGGIGGLASAILLARKGYEVTIFEKAQMARPVGAGFLLQPPGQYVLGQIGALDHVRSKSVPIKKLISVNASGRSILNLDYDHLDGSNRHGLGVQRSTIYNALYHIALNLHLINFEWDSSVEGCDIEPGCVSVKANDQQRHYDFCIISSGAHSDLADEHFPRRVSNVYDWGCIWTTFGLPDGFSADTLHQRCSRASKMMGILPVIRSGDRYKAALYWSAKTGLMKEIDGKGIIAMKQEIADFWPEAGSHIENLDHDDFIPATYRDVWTPNPIKGRLVAIGDISHATSPQLGQGCTMALLDAYTLVEALDEQPDIDAALERWWRTRKRQIMYVRHLSRFVTPLFQSEHNIYSLFRDFVMAPMGRLPPFHNLQLKSLASEVFLDSSIKERNN